MPSPIRWFLCALAALCALLPGAARAAPSAKYCPPDMPEASELDPVVLVGSAEGAYFKSLIDQMEFCGWDRARIFPRYRQPTGCVAEEAAEVRDFIEDVLAETGAARADALGLSLGGVLVRHWITFLGGADRVRETVLWGAPNHGSPYTKPDDPYCWMREIRESDPYIACLNGEDPGPLCGNPYAPEIAAMAAPPGSPPEAGIAYYNLFSSEDLFLFKRNSILEGATNLDLPNTIHTDLAKKAEVFRLSMLGFLRRPAAVDPKYSGCGTLADGRGSAAWAWLLLAPAAMLILRRRRQ